MAAKNAAVAASLALLLTSCAPNPQKAIVGKWVPAKPGGIEFLDFGGDGTLTVKFEGLNEAVTGSYTLVDDQTLETDVHKTLMAKRDHPGGFSIVVPDWLFVGKGTIEVSREELHVKGRKQDVIYRRAN